MKITRGRLLVLGITGGLLLAGVTRVLSQVDWQTQVIGRSNGLRVQTDQAGGQLASFGGVGEFAIDAPFIPGGRLDVKEDGKVGIGTASPSSRFHLRVPPSGNPISAMTVDVDSFTNVPNAQASHFFRVRDIGANAPSAFMIRGDGNVGIGTDGPPERLTVAGTVQSTAGGFKFPDGSVQTSAANAATYTTLRTNNVQLPAFYDPFGSAVSVLHLNLPDGTYLVQATVGLYNPANNFGQNNSRSAACWFPNEGFNNSTNAGYKVFLNGGFGSETISFHAVLTISGGIDVHCTATEFSNPTSVYTAQRRLTAVNLGGIVNVQ